MDETDLAILQTLKSKGTWKNIKLQLQHEILNCILEKQHQQPSSQQSTEETAILDAVVKQYLEFSGYKHTLNTFNLERENISGDAGITAATEFYEAVHKVELPKSVPILYSLFFTQ
jgi:hypothetical protein